MKRILAAALLAVSVAAWACAGDRPGSPSDVSEHPSLKLTTAHFQLFADRIDQAALNLVAGLLEANYPRITSDLGVAGLPVTSVWLWQDRASFYADMQAHAGRVYAGSGGYVRGRNAVSVLAAAGAGAAAEAAVHEFAHVVSMAVNPAIPNNPRWLWETVALYENRELVDPRTLAYMQAGRYPSLADLDAAYDSSGGRQVYEVGYVLGEFIVGTWGANGLIRLIQRNGDVQAALGLTVAAFESRWHAFLHAEYGLPA
ncbi:MAG: hypothetical protein H6Q10_1199 [Acidobacteria bacterium]|nr:hypothetical protein [Acidobacteriota bacterium]